MLILMEPEMLWCSGGRYDHLVEKFGKSTPSIGFAILLDELMNALNRQKINIDCGYTDSDRIYGKDLFRGQ